MEELLAFLAQTDGSGDDWILIRSMVWGENWLELGITVSIQEQPSSWKLRCGNLFSHMMVGFGGWLDFRADHPLLWEYRRPHAEAFISGRPDNAEACVGALYAAHEKATGGWLQFGSHINKCPTVLDLMRGGNGLLARAPMPLLVVYKAALEPHGLEVDILRERPASIRQNGRYRETANEDVRVVILDKSYFIGVGWSAVRVD